MPASKPRHDSTDQNSPYSIWVQLAALIGFVTLCLAVGSLGALATTPKIEGWFAELDKPSWNPPDWIFGPVWTTLYLMMGISVWFVFRAATTAPRWPAFLAFGMQLGLNSLWSLLFFGLESPPFAAIEIVFLWLAIVVTLVLFWKFSKIASCLLIPYLAWVSFAAVLNFTIWRLNVRVIRCVETGLKPSKKPANFRAKIRNTARSKFAALLR